MILNKKSLKYLLQGSAFLGSGGGGSIASGVKFLEKIGNKKINLITRLDEETAKLIGCIICDIGSITKFDDRQDEALDFAYKLLRREFETTLGSIQVFLPIETGPENTLAPFVLAARYNLSILDADGAGRAIPTLPLCTFMSENVENIQPIALANGAGDGIIVSTPDTSRLEEILRNMASTKTYASSASVAIFPNTLEELSKKSVSGSISNALYCGELLTAIRNADEDKKQAMLACVNSLEAYLVTSGEVCFKTSAEDNAFNFTTTKIKSAYDDTMTTILSQNESLIAFNDSCYEPVAIAPDSICFLNYQFRPLTNVEVLAVDDNNKRKKQKIHVIAVKANSKLTDSKIMKSFEKIIHDLGYAGNMKINIPLLMPLGDLLVKLYNDSRS